MRRVQKNMFSNLNMKKIVGIGVVMVLLLMAGSSCTKRVELADFQYSDTTAYAAVSLELELPVSGGKNAIQMRDSILAIFLADLKESGYEDMQGYGLPEKAQDSDYQSLIDNYGKQMLAYLSENAAPFDEELGSKWEYNLSMTSLMDTTKYVVYSCSGDMYMGGTSVQIIGSGTVIFAKENAKVIRQIIDENALDSVQTLLRKGLLSYYAGNGAELTEDELFDYLQMMDDNGILLERIPLPKDCPSLSYDGVGFYYEEGEIAPAEDGLINFVVPFEEITPYLTSEAQELLK